MSAIIMLDARPANTKEIILIQHRIQDLTKLCGHCRKLSKLRHQRSQTRPSRVK